ncbi:hypothetical protein ACYSNO_10915 [Enterococcus sp. LJL98]
MNVDKIAFTDGFEIRKLESGTINVYKTEYVGNRQNKKYLREIASNLGVDILNSRGNEKGTRQLGNDIIKAINN